MCFGGGSSRQTVTQVPAQKTPEEQEAIRLALQSLQMRQALLPFLLQEAGFGMGGGTSPPGSLPGSPPPPGAATPPPGSPPPIGTPPPSTQSSGFTNPWWLTGATTPPGGFSPSPSVGAAPPPTVGVPPTPPGSPGGGFNLFRLPPTANQQGINALTGSSLGGANEAVMMLLQRLRAGQSLIPNLMSSVQASLPPGLGSPQAPPFWQQQGVTPEQFMRHLIG